MEFRSYVIRLRPPTIGLFIAFVLLGILWIGFRNKLFTSTAGIFFGFCSVYLSEYLEPQSLPIYKKVVSIIATAFIGIGLVQLFEYIMVSVIFGYAVGVIIAWTAPVFLQTKQGN